MYNFIPVNLFPKNVTNIIFEQKNYVLVETYYDLIFNI